MVGMSDVASPTYQVLAHVPGQQLPALTSDLWISFTENKQCSALNGSSSDATSFDMLSCLLLCFFLRFHDLLYTLLFFFIYCLSFSICWDYTSLSMHVTQNFFHTLTEAIHRT